MQPSGSGRAGYRGRGNVNWRNPQGRNLEGRPNFHRGRGRANFNPRNFNQSGANFNSERPNYDEQGNSFNRGRGNLRWQRGGSSRGGHNNPNQHLRTMGFRYLQTLLDEEPEQLSVKLQSDRRGFNDLLRTDMSNDFIILVIRVLRKVCDSPFNDSKYQVLHTAFNEHFVKALITYLALLPMQGTKERKQNVFFWEDSNQFWNNLIEIGRDLLTTTPTFACVALPDVINALKVTIPSFEAQHQMHVSDEIKEKVDKLLKEVKVMAVKETEKKAKSQLGLCADEEPPNDFREISVYPNPLEVVGERTFLRPNVIEGPYKNVNHYLDVQFRLLREDFVRPLREGVVNYLFQTKRKLENIKIYKKIHFLNPETVNESFCIRIRFNFTKIKGSFKFEKSKRFMHGCLLCFTPDNFRNIFFGKVCNRKVEDLEKGELLVGFDSNPRVLYLRDYLMVECSVYFEPYYHVLSVLQTMPEDNFPMEKYLIQVDPSVRPPKYLTPAIVYTVERHEFNALQWPDRNFYGLNESQQEAFKAAMTQDFTLIQGPPGTGKTFLGLKIAITLLRNHEAWFERSPMLVVCFTNHALDQFLEGLLSCTQEIIRVGGQSKNENLQKFNLRSRRIRFDDAVIGHKLAMQRCVSEIGQATETLKFLESFRGVVRFEVFEQVITNYQATWFSRANYDNITDWLFGGRERGRETLGNRGNEDNGVAVVAEQLNNLRVGEGNESGDEDSSDDGHEEENHFNDDFLAEMFENVQELNCSRSLITLGYIGKKIDQGSSLLRLYEQNEFPDLETIVMMEQLRLELVKLTDDHNYLQMRLAEGCKHRLQPRTPRNVDLDNPNNMRPDDRWILYFYWVSLYELKMREKLDILDRDFRTKYRIYEEMRKIEDTKAMKSVLVVGMTTTCAARLRSTLQSLKSPIVIVEEAAEVLEAHIVTALTPHCQQLILIGDHQQLKPNTANYTIEKKYQLGISLFERMVINKIQCFTLNVQHRMRPEISCLIRPTIYPFLIDHESVMNRPQIKGVDNCLFFVDHKEREQECEGASKKNLHESTFLINFARHLILNGYKAENITILAAYLGQMFEIQRAKKLDRDLLQDVRVSVLDNYQGEECDIILLSLVRSNEEGKIGFLSIENRVCVALSRARNGMYVIGNMKQLCDKSELWGKIRTSLQEQDAIGAELPLRCQVHPLTVTRVKCGDDFNAISEGGCSQICNSDLPCGHKCAVLCHVKDRAHATYKCRLQCEKKLCTENKNHICQKMCFEDCGYCKYPVIRQLDCGHAVELECFRDPHKVDCVVLVTTKLPCGHEAEKPCYIDAQIFKCPHPCESKVEPCGHACALRCHARKDPDHLQYKCTKPCAKYQKNCSLQIETHTCPKLCYEDCSECEIVVKKNRTVCPHVYNVLCNSDVDAINCVKPCTKLLGCGHKCKSFCNEPCGKCTVKVDKKAPLCNHSVKAICSEEPQRKNCNRKCPLQLSCGHPCTTKCNEPCTINCKVNVAYSVAGKCGHTVKEVPCYLRKSGVDDSDTLMKFCTSPCQVGLKCGHPCSGTCGECFQGRIHKRCSEKCGVPLVCDHECPEPCREACKPCKLPCPYRCIHSACRKKCGEPCTSCKERCARRCEHQICTGYCGAICKVPPCEQPCQVQLGCGHVCAGFCADPCPPCRVCNEEVSEIFFGTEDEEDARFVLLRDCGHVVENSGMENWLKQNEEQISYKVCPKCKTAIKTTQRYSDYIKRAMQEVSLVKLKMNGTPKENEEERKELLRKVATAKSVHSLLSLFCPSVGRVLVVLEERLQVTRKNKNQPINRLNLNAITAKMQIMEQILDMCCNSKVKIAHSKELFLSQVKLISNVLLRESDSVTNQEIDDIQRELQRLHLIVQYSQLRQSENFRSFTNDEVRRCTEEVDRCTSSLAVFTDENEGTFTAALQRLNKAIQSSSVITAAERKTIVAAMGLQKGHWFKCPNGHPYAIGECGGAMQVSKCFCGAAIGGTQHRLLHDNAVATEMDGAVHGAWSLAANMNNYHL